jgi:hypothetical protein
MLTVSSNNLEENVGYWLRNCENIQLSSFLYTILLSLSSIHSPHRRKFCYAELQNFKRRGGYQQLARRGVKTAAKLSLAAELLANDLASTSTEEAQRLVQRMRQLENEVRLCTQLVVVWRYDCCYRWRVW